MKEFIVIDSTNDTDPTNHYNPVCRLNNDALVAGFCTQKCVNLYTYDVILKDYPEITEDVVKALCEPCVFIFTPSHINIICTVKNNGKSKEEAYDMINLFSNYNPGLNREEVYQHYTECP